MNIPMNVEYEKSVIAGMMNDSNCYFDAMAEIGEEYFADETANRLFLQQAKAGSPMSVDMLMKTIEEPRLKSAARAFDNAWISRGEFEHSLKGLKDTYLKRQLYHTIKKAERMFNDADGEQVISTIQNEINSYTFNNKGENMIFPEDRAVYALAEYLERRKDPEKSRGLPYSYKEGNRTLGFPALDKVFHGAHGGDLIMLAAKTGEGKTALAIQLARILSFHKDHWGYYMNAEMRKVEMEARLLAPIAGVNANEILHGQLEGNTAEQEEKHEKIINSYKKLKTSKLVMSRIPDLPLHKAKGLANQLKAKMPELEYLIVDYVGRMEVRDFKGNSWDELYEITKQLKELAITLDIPVFILAQRNSDGAVEGAKKMMNECDGVLFFEPTTEEDEKDIKNRTNEVSAEMINYKITKKKVRRDDNPYPIYCLFDKKKNFITELR